MDCISQKFVEEKVREAKKANREVPTDSCFYLIGIFQYYVFSGVLFYNFISSQARKARKKALDEMSSETKAAFENMKFYKFYPVTTSDSPDVSSVKVNLSKQIYEA